MIEIIPNYHPMLVHFTIALITTSLGMAILSFVLSPWDKIKQECLIVSRWCLWLGAIASVFTIAAGFHAYFTVAHDTVSHHVMKIHRNLALITFTFIWILTIWSLFLFVKKQSLKWVYVMLLIATFGLLLITGWYGTELVYRYGIGVKSLPEISEKGHQHSREIKPRSSLELNQQKQHMGEAHGY